MLKMPNCLGEVDPPLKNMLKTGENKNLETAKEKSA